MAGLGTIATTSIITKGLHNNSACSGLILASVSLYPFTITVLPPNYASNGGSQPMAPGQIQHFYQNVNDVRQPVIPFYVKNETSVFPRNNSLVTIKMNMFGNEIEKIYAIPEKRANILINIINIYNVTLKNVKVNINNIKHVISRISVKITKITKR